jgi:hypothetical protein
MLESNDSVPAVLQSLDSERRVSGRWIATVLEKRLKTIHRDLERFIPEQVPKWYRTENLNGSVSEYRIPLADACFCIAQYQGQRSLFARDLIRSAISFYIQEKPRLEKEFDTLREKLEELATKKLGAPPKIGMVPVAVVENNLWGEPTITRYVYMPANEAPEKAKAKGLIRHMQKQIKGMMNKMNELQDFVDGAVCELSETPLDSI